MRTTSCTLLIVLASCRHQPPPPRAVTPVAPVVPLPGAVTPAEQPLAAHHGPAMLAHVGNWPDPVAIVDGVPVAKKALVSDLQAAVEGGVLADDVDEVTGMRAAATALEARIDALIVEKAVGKDAVKAQPALDAELAREIGQAGGRENWLSILKKRGVSEEARRRTLTTAAQLHVLVEAQTPFTASDAELRERYAEQARSLVVPAAVQVLEVAEPLALTPTAAQLADAQARVAQAVAAGKWSTPPQGWQTPRALGTVRWAAVAGLQPGQTTAVLRTPFGLHQLKVVAQRAEHKLTFAEAKPELAAYLQRLKWVRLDTIALAKLRAEAKVQRFSPFDKPPGGLPLAGAVTMAEFEEEED